MNLSFPIEYNKHTLKDVKFTPWQYDKAMRDELKFSVSVPESLKLFKSFNNPPTIQFPLVDCAYFKANDGSMEVIIQSSYLQNEISLQHYYQYLNKQGEEIIIYERLIKDDTDAPDVLSSRKFPDGQTWVTRRTGFKVFCGDGAFVITINVTVNKDNYESKADLIYAVTSSLKPLKKPAYAYAEKLRLFTRKDPGDFATYIPFSWNELHHHNNTLQKFNAVFTKKLQEKISGLLTISTLSIKEASAHQLALKIFHEGYEKQGMNMKDIPLNKSGNLKCFNAVSKGNMDFPASKENQKEKNNITFYITQHKKSWFYIEMFGPSKDTNFEAWAINDRALYLVAENFKVT